MSPNRRGMLSAGAAIASSLVAGCTGMLGSGSGSDDTITFGVTASLSGAYSGAGTRYLNGYKIWRDLVNENGGILDREVELVNYDDESSPERSLTLYNRLVDQDNVDLLFGPYASPINYSAANASAQHQLPMVTGAASDPGLFDRGFEYYYSTQSKTTKYGRAFPRFLGEVVDWGQHDMEEPETAAVLYTEGAFTTDIGESAISNFEEFGYEVVHDEQHPSDVSDYSNIITRVKDADPDILAIYGFPQTEATFASQARESDLNVDVHYQNYSSTNAILETLGEYSNYIFHGAWWDERYEFPMTDELVSTWQDRHPDLAVGMESAYGPSAGQAFQTAIEEAGSINPDDVNAALAEINTETVMGPTEFHETGWNLHQYESEAVRQWQNEERVLLVPTEFSDGEPWLPTSKWSNRTEAPSN